MEYAGFWRRNIAIFLDLFPCIALFLLIDLVTGGNYFLSNLIYQFLCAAYFIALTASNFQGTLGQKILKIKIGSNTGDKLSVIQSALRYFVWAVPVWPLIAYSSLPNYGLLMDRLGNIEFAETNPEAYLNFMDTPEVQSFIAINVALAAVMLVIGLIWALPIAFTKEKTGIHDMLCKQRAFKK